MTKTDEGRLTDRDHWVEYWNSKTSLVDDVDGLFLVDWYSDVIRDRVLPAAKARGAKPSSMEMGGFPGQFSVYLVKHFGFQTALLDLVVLPDIVNKLAVRNQVDPAAVTCHEGDMFEFETEERFDLVFSNGLVEHFKDLKGVMARHASLLAPGGTLFVTVPNLRGWNGAFQKYADRANYDTHEIACMTPEALAQQCRDLGLVNIEARRHGRWGLWLENDQSRPKPLRAARLGAYGVGRFASQVRPAGHPWFAPFVGVVATRPA